MELNQKLEKGVLKMSRPMSIVAGYSCKVKLFGTFIHKLDWDSK